jgi:hypothetical protein
MAVFEYIRDYIARYDTKDLKKATLSIALIFSLIILYLFYMRYKNAEDFLARIASLNKERGRTQKIIALRTRLKSERQDADLLLSEDKNFRLLDYFNILTRDLGIFPSSPPQVAAPRDLDMGYNEIELTALFMGIHTKQLVVLLETIDKNKRIYTKELIIDKSQKTPTIDIKLTIATLEPVAHI